MPLFLSRLSYLYVLIIRSSDRRKIRKDVVATVRFEGLFEVEYKDSKVCFGSSEQPAGSFVISLLNQNDRDQLWHRFLLLSDSAVHRVRDELAHGYVNCGHFVSAGDAAARAFAQLPKLLPISEEDAKHGAQMIRDLFCIENAAVLQEYFRKRAELSLLSPEAVADGNAFAKFIPDSAFFDEAEELRKEVVRILKFTDQLPSDIEDVCNRLDEFVSITALEADKKEEEGLLWEEPVPQVVHYDKKHLLPYALQAFEGVLFSVIQCHSFIRHDKDGSPVFAKRISFDRLFDLIANDFFEGLHCGHYPRRCAVCGKVFLMCDATRQKYCNSPASIKVRGKILTCKLYAAAMGKKERAKDDPVVRVYDRICQYIYTAKSRNQLTASDEEAFCRHAAQLKEKVRRDSSYSFEAYTADMAALVAKVKRRMNG